MKVEFNKMELRIILYWAEQATQGIYSFGERFITDEEDKLLDKLTQMYKEETPENCPENIPPEKKDFNK